LQPSVGTINVQRAGLAAHLSAGSPPPPTTEFRRRGSENTKLRRRAIALDDMGALNKIAFRAAPNAGTVFASWDNNTGETIDMTRRIQSTVLPLLLAAAVILPARWAKAQDLLAQIKQRGEIVVGTELQFAPFEFLEGDKPVGFDVDMIDRMAKDWGVKVTWVDLPWASVLPALEAKKFDLVVAGTTISKARLERYYMTLPIGDATVALVKRADDTAINKPSDIAGKVVASMKGSAQLQILTDYAKTLPGGAADIKAYIGSSNAYADLAAGRVEAVATSLPNLLYLQKTQPSFAVVLPPFGPPAYLAWVLRKTPDSVPLRDAVDAEIKKFDRDGTVKTLQTKWFGKDVTLPYENIPAPQY
jgi:polar amino acid transport system substrate-binding protein